MSRVGELHKRMMEKLAAGIHWVTLAQARLENADLTEEAQADLITDALACARSFLAEAEKLALWLDTGEAG